MNAAVYAKYKSKETQNHTDNLDSTSLHVAVIYKNQFIKCTMQM